MFLCYIPGDSEVVLGVCSCCCQTDSKSSTFLVLFYHPFHPTVQKVLLTDTAETDLIQLSEIYS